MDPLRIIKLIDIAAVVLLVFVLIIVGGSSGATYWVLASSNPELVSVLIPSMAITACSMLIVGIMALLAAVAAMRIEQGGGRAAQTMLAIIFS